MLQIMDADLETTDYTFFKWELFTVFHVYSSS